MTRVKLYNIATGHVENVWVEDATHPAVDAEPYLKMMTDGDHNTDHVYYISEDDES